MFSFEKRREDSRYLVLAPVMMMKEDQYVEVVDPRTKSISRFTMKSLESFLDLDGKEWSVAQSGDATAFHAFVEKVSRLGLVEQGNPENRAYNATKIKQAMYETRGIPGRIILNPPALPTVNINERCGFRCLHCYNATGFGTIPEMTAEVIVEHILKPLASIGCVNVMWCGGDPVLTPDKTTQCTAIASDLGISTAVQVAEFSKDFLRSFAAVGGNGVQVSLYSSPDHPEIDDQFRGRSGSWKMAVQNIEEAKRNGLSVFVNMVLFPENASELSRTAEFAYTMGVDTFRTTFAVITGRATRNRKMLEFSKEETERLMSAAVALQESFSGRMEIITDISVQGKPDDLPYSFCSAGMTYMHVAGYNVYPCNFMMDDQFCMGSVSEQPVDQIWQTSAVVWSFRSSETLHPACIKCTKRESPELICTDCKAVMWQRYGSYLNAHTVACAHKAHLHSS